jgi:hypothetical protein
MERTTDETERAMDETERGTDEPELYMGAGADHSSALHAPLDGSDPIEHGVRGPLARSDSIGAHWDPEDRDPIKASWDRVKDRNPIEPPWDLAEELELTHDPIEDRWNPPCDPDPSCDPVAEWLAPEDAWHGRSYVPTQPRGRVARTPPPHRWMGGAHCGQVIDTG